MAIYRLEKKSISRGSGGNLCAAVAYRSGLKMTDTNDKNPDAKTHDYRSKSDVVHTDVLMNESLMVKGINAGVSFNPASIAQLVENSEVTKRGKLKVNAKLASEFVLAGSHELSLAENVAMFSKFAEKMAIDQNTIVMFFVHDPKVKPSKKRNTGGDDRNIHAHVVMLSRQVSIENDKLVLGEKIDLDLSDTERLKRGLSSGSEALKNIRAEWADIQNNCHYRHNIAPVTHESYKSQGLSVKPTLHLGRHNSELMREGKYSKVGEHNEKIRQQNNQYIIDTANRCAIDARTAIDDSEQAIDGYRKQAEQSNIRVGTVDFGEKITHRRRAIDGIEQSIMGYRRQAEQSNIRVGTVDFGEKITHRQRAVNDSEQAIKGYAEQAEQSNTRVGTVDFGERITHRQRAVNDSEQAIKGYQQAVDGYQQAVNDSKQAVDSRNLALFVNNKVMVRTAYNLVNLQIYASVEPGSIIYGPKFKGTISFGFELDKIVKRFRKGDKAEAVGITPHGVDVNAHLSGNQTAQNVKDFMMKNVMNQDVLMHYNNLLIKDFLDKYSIEYSHEDLKKLHEINQPKADELATLAEDNRLENPIQQSVARPRPSQDYISPSPFD